MEEWPQHSQSCPQNSCDFRKLMNKVRQSGVNLNRITATELMFYFYNTMPKPEFQALSQQVKDIDTKDIKDMKTIVSCGSDSDEYSCSGRRYPSRRGGYSCGGHEDDNRYC